MASNSNQNLAPTVSFADVAHQTLSFDASDPTTGLLLSLIDTCWVQRLRHIRQTGNTNLVYMYAEHSRFGHSLGVAYLANLLMQKLSRNYAALVGPFRDAVAAAALLHDIGHVAPGSHIATRTWAPDSGDSHEKISCRVVLEDKEIHGILAERNRELPEMVARILSEDKSLPHWTTAIISGGGWNADRGNWAIVDSAMCSVHYGRYNVLALIDAFHLSQDGDLVIQESRLDALTHFFVARDSMYRQVYQHRVLQAADALNFNIVLRLRDLIAQERDVVKTQKLLENLAIYCDQTMLAVLISKNYALELPLETISKMTESWWRYHLERWSECGDSILRDLTLRFTQRNLFKTVRFTTEESHLREKAVTIAQELGYDPRYYVCRIDNSDRHRGKKEDVPLVLLDDGKIVPVTQIEPLIAKLLERPETIRSWLAVPKEIKERLGRSR